MTIEIIKKQIDKFIGSEEPGVLAIKGEWGIGKTFAWNKYLLEARKENRIGLKKYSYVSIFGINSLDVFKYSIFENVIDRNLISTQANIDTFKKNSVDLLASLGRKSVKLVKGTSLLKDFTPAIESFSFLSLDKHLICIDDLERRGDELSIKDVLGLISLLKEQKKCQVVILLNDGEKGLEDYDKYREKVIDIELAFEPNPKECADIAYSNDTPHQNRLKELTISLGIRNIRVLKKIERLVCLAHPIAEEFEQEVFDQVMHSITLLSWSYYYSGSKDEVPPIEFITNSGYVLFGLGGKEVTEKEREWHTTIQAYGYKLTDELDILLAEAVKTGYFVEEEFKKIASAKNQHILDSKSQDSFSNAWGLYHDTFNNNSTEVINGLHESFKRNYKNITPLNLNGTVLLFRDLDENDKASELINFYIENRKDEIELFNIEQSNFYGDIIDQELIDKFKAVYEQSVTIETAKQVLDRIAHRNSWDPSDEVVLANTPVNDYYDLFKAESGRNLSSFVTTCLKFGQFGNASERLKEISNRATEALRRIANESKINKIRVKKFGVDLENSSQDTTTDQTSNLSQN